MSSPPSTRTALSEFLAYLQGLTTRPELAELEARLNSLQVSREDIALYANFRQHSYARNLVCETEVAQLLCLCWRSGQRSPIHDHADSVCGVRIVEGIATETRFTRVPSGYIKATDSTDFQPNTVMVSQDADTHQISNLQEEGKDLVTLHFYSPPLNRMKTYSIESRETSDYRPHNHVALLDGGGI